MVPKKGLGWAAAKILSKHGENAAELLISKTVPKLGCEIIVERVERAGTIVMLRPQTSLDSPPV